MKAILGRIREIIGYKEDDELPISFKRDRESDDDPPIMKKYKTVSNHFPKVMPKEDEEEWLAPKRTTLSSRERIVPITLEINAPSTSTPASQTTEPRNLIKPLERFDFKKLDHPFPSSSRWKDSSKILEKTLDSDFRVSNPNPMQNERLSLFRSERSNLLRLPLSSKPSFPDINLSILGLPSTSQNKFFKRTTPIPILPSVETAHRERRSDPYEFCTNSTPKESYKFFKSSKNMSDKSNKLEVIDISDSEDHTYYVVKEPKNRHSDVVESVQIEESDEGEEEEDGKSCRSCKSKSALRRSMSPHPRDKFHRFKMPLSKGKTRLMNSYTPFWKSQRRSSSGLTSKPIGRLKLLENTKAIAERCFRLDDKKKYEELIKLSTGSYFRRNNPSAPSIFSLTDAQKKILDLTSNEFRDRNECENDLRNGTSEKSTPEEGSVVVLSDGENDQPASPDDSSTSSSVKILPVNSLKQSFKDKSVASSSWIEELDRKYKNIRIDKKQEEEDRLLLSSKHSKTNRELWFKLKAKHLQSLQIDLTVEEDASKEVPLPELTNEQENIIQHALRPNPPNQVLIHKFNLDITRRDINTLAGLNWLNDEVINFYMNLIMERSQENSNLPKVYAMNTFFYPKLMQTGQAGLRRWTRRVDIFSYHMIVAPIHLGVHWCMSIIDLRKKSIKYFDSMGGKNMDCCDALLKYLEDESMDKKQTKFDTKGWVKDCVKDIPQQMNGSDCGMFSCTFAEFLSRDAPITFSQNEMPYLRRKMVLEIVQGKLLL